MIKKIKQKLILFLIITFVFSNFFIFQIPTTQAATSIPNPSSPPNCNYPEFYDYGEQLLKTQTLTKANSPYCLRNFNN